MTRAACSSSNDWPSSGSISRTLSFTDDSSRGNGFSATITNNNQLTAFAHVQQNCNKTTGSSHRLLRFPGNEFITEQNVALQTCTELVLYCRASHNSNATAIQQNKLFYCSFIKFHCISTNPIMRDFETFHYRRSVFCYASCNGNRVRRYSTLTNP